MTKEQAAAILDVGTDATVDQVRKKFEVLFSDYQVRLSNAPTPSLKKTFQERLRELQAAADALHPGVTSKHEDLPGTSPVVASPVPPSRPPSQAAARPAPPGPPAGLPASLRLAILVSIFLAAFGAFATIRWFKAQALLGESEPERSEPKAAATLLILADEVCNVTINGRPAGGLAAGEKKVFPLETLGKQLVEATTADGLTWSAEVRIEKAGQEIVRTGLVAIRTKWAQGIDGDTEDRLGELTGGEALSPDGRWRAFISNESGRNEIYVVPVSGQGGKWQVTARGANRFRWLANGDGILYSNVEGDIRTVSIAVHGENLEIGEN